jgi:hypothetical protein
VETPARRTREREWPEVDWQAVDTDHLEQASGLLDREWVHVEAGDASRRFVVGKAKTAGRGVS